MGNTQSYGHSSDDQELSKINEGTNNSERSQLSMTEQKIIFLMFQSLQRRLQMTGITLNSFLKFCPIDGFWSTRIFKVLSSGQDSISLHQFYFGAKLLCKSSDDELDEFIFSVFDLSNQKMIAPEIMKIMLSHIPDLGFENFDVKSDDIHVRKMATLCI